MTAPQFFGALIRAIGLYWFVYGLAYLPATLSPHDGTALSTYILIGTGYMIIGAFLLFKADGFVETCYSTDALRMPQEPKNSDSL